MSCNFFYFVFFKGEEEDPGNFTAVSQTSIPGNILEQIIKQSVYKNLDDNRMAKKQTEKICQKQITSSKQSNFLHCQDNQLSG